jgi:5-methylcytosine-specific restriction endonuclease McrA
MKTNGIQTPAVAAACHESARTHGSYGALNLHPKWKAKRAEILKRDGYKCANCSRTEDLEIHHRRYVYSIARRAYLNPWEYFDEELLTLCRTCHQKGHRMYEVPTFLCE